ncbi:carboxylate--amine ligase, partial [Thiomonas sp.]
MTARAEKPPVILLGGDINVLSVARRLEPIGVDVYALGTSASLAFSSRHVRGIDFPPSAEPGDAWLQWLTGPKAAALQGAILLPCSDDGITLVARHGEALRQRYRLTEGRPDVLLALLDKVESYDLAQRAGVPTPKYRAVRSIEEAVAAAQWIGYPCGLKPRLGHVFRRSFDAKLFVVDDRTALEDVYRTVQTQDSEMLMTEIVPGPEDAYSSCFTYLDDRLEPMFVLTKRKIRQFPPGFGLGTCHATDWNPEVAELGLRFLRGCGLSGLANVEFKRDSRDGQYKLIECNARFTLNHELLEVAGVPAARIVYNRLAGLPPLKVARYRRNVHVLLPMADIRAFRELRRRGEITVWQWLRSLLHVPHFLVFRWTDPGPWLHAVRRYWSQKLARRQ